MTRPKGIISKDLFFYQDTQLEVIVQREGYHILPMTENRRVIGQSIFIKRENIISLKHSWAKINKNWKYLVIHMEKETSVEFLSDDKKIDKYFRIMMGTNSPRRFIDCWDKVSTVKDTMLSYTEGATKLRFKNQ